MKKDVGNAYLAIRMIHYNVMRFKETLVVDEVEILPGHFKSVSGIHYVLHDPEKNTVTKISLRLSLLRSRLIYESSCERYYKLEKKEE